MPLSFSGYQTQSVRFQQDLEPSTGEVLGATARQTITELPVPSTYRMVELAGAELRGTRLDAPTARQRLKDAGLEGRLTVPDTGITDAALGVLMERKRNEIKRQEVLSRAPTGVGPAALQLGTAFATSLLDPLNIGLAFVPVVGEARYMRYLANTRGIIGRTGVRAGVGAVEGAAGAAIIEPLVYSAKTQEQADYDMTDSLLNVAFGTVFGGGLHATAGGMGDAISALRPTEREALLRTAVAQAMQGREVAVDTVTPRGFGSKIPRDPSLSPEYQSLEHSFAEALEADVDGAVRSYAALDDAEGGRVLNTDTARELSPDYRADRTRSAAVHEPASWLVKEMYARQLKEALPHGRRNMVLFTGGGTGAGKSSGLRLLGGLKDEAHIIFDTNMNGLKSAATKIDQALAAGKEVEVVYTWRDPVDALVKGALPRAMRMGRTVPVAEHANTHVGAAKTIKELIQKYADDDRVRVTIIDNSHGAGGARVGSVADVPELAYDSVLGDLYAALEAERQAGRISEAIYRGTAGIQEQGRAGRVEQPARAADRGQSEQERARRQIDAARAAAERHASPESDLTADVRASAAADRQLAEQPTAADPIAEQEALLADELAELQDVARVAGIDVSEELAEADELIKLAEEYGRAARAAVLCGLGHAA